MLLIVIEGDAAAAGIFAAIDEELRHEEVFPKGHADAAVVFQTAVIIHSDKRVICRDRAVKSQLSALFDHQIHPGERDIRSLGNRDRRFDLNIVVHIGGGMRVRILRRSAQRFQVGGGVHHRELVRMVDCEARVCPANDRGADDRGLRAQRNKSFIVKHDAARALDLQLPGFQDALDRERHAIRDKDLGTLGIYAHARRDGEILLDRDGAEVNELHILRRVFGFAGFLQIVVEDAAWHEACTRIVHHPAVAAEIDA